MGKINKETLKLAYDLDAMATYAKSNGQELITDLISESTLFDGDNGIRTISGIKSTDKFADVSEKYTVIQATSGDISTVSLSGQTTLADIDISVIEVCVKEKYTKTTLSSKISQLLMKPGSDYSNELPYSDTLVSLKSKIIAKNNDLQFWQGATGGTYSLFDGIIRQCLDGSSDTGAATGMTSANAITHVEAVVLAATTANPEWLDMGAFMYMSPKQFSTYHRAVYGLGGVIDGQTKNENNVVTSFMIPGYNIKVISTIGLEGVDNILVTRQDNFVVGTDLESETDTFEFAYLTEAQYWRLVAIWKLGAKVARTAEVYLTN